MSDLSALLADTTRPAVVADLEELANTTVSDQSGVTGMAVKTAMKAATKVDRDIVGKAINRLLPDLLGALNPQWETFNGGDFGAHLDPDATADALLRVADDQAERANNSVLQKGYSSLRGKAKKILTPAVPELGRILQRHMGE